MSLFTFVVNFCLYFTVTCWTYEIMMGHGSTRTDPRPTWPIQKVTHLTHWGTDPSTCSDIYRQPYLYCLSSSSSSFMRTGHCLVACHGRHVVAMQSLRRYQGADDTIHDHSTQWWWKVSVSLDVRLIYLGCFPHENWVTYQCCADGSGSISHFGSSEKSFKWQAAWRRRDIAVPFRDTVKLLGADT